MLRETLQQTLRAAVQQAFADVNLPDLKLERPRNPDHGDYAVNVASLSKVLRQPPPAIAQAIMTALAQQPGFANAWQVSVIGAFINVTMVPALMARALAKQLHQAVPGQNTHLQGQVISLEFVSANPTGPLHIGHGRWAALGDSLRRILTHSGARVRPEFYINDAGAQMNNLARSLWWRCLMQLDPAVTFPARPDNADEPYPYYAGDYLTAVSAAFLAAHPQAFDDQSMDGPDENGPLFQQLRQFARRELLAMQQATLTQLGVTFDRWISETALYESGAVAQALQRVEATGHTYEQDGALWLRTTDFGDEKDRVLRKSDGSYTYLTPDIACHLNKWEHRPTPDASAITQLVNIWGADHHGYMARLQACMTLLGLPDNALRIVLGQLVNLIVDGAVTRMGKRRTMVTLQDLVDEAGVDATRFWMVSKSADTTLDFDVALATSQSSENPVFYAQYAHARCCGIIRNAVEASVHRDTGAPVSPLLNDWPAYRQSVTVDQVQTLWTTLDTAEQQSAVKAVLLRLDGFTDVVADAARLMTPHLVARYTLDLAADFHHFYTHCRVLTDQPAVTQARLLLIDAIRSILATALDLLGVSAPVRM
jgi:arginyl-tRNA synthetase